MDDDPGVSQAIARDLRRKYGAEFQIVRTLSGADALELLAEYRLRDRQVALIASDQRMPEMTGVEFLERAQELAPEAKLVLLTAYADTEAAIRAINEIGLDHYLMKPWDPPEERLYPVADELLADWQAAHPDTSGELRVVGHRWSEGGHEVKTFLSRNHVPYRWLDVERDDEARRLVDLAEVGPDQLPLVLVPDGDTLRSPSILELANALGLRTAAEQPLYDLCIVGAGPAGLAAAVYGASEGLRTVIVEREAPGGQAGQSAAIENYLGFPRGLTGQELANRAVAQARRFGAEMIVARDVTTFEVRGPVHGVCFADGSSIEARAVLVASGVSYRIIDAPGVNDFVGRGVYYGATAGDARSCEGDDVYVVGAANSAGQAVLNFARFARRVVMLVRSDSLETSMSKYLADRIEAAANVEVRFETQVIGGRGDGHLEAITLSDRRAGTEEEVPAEGLYIFIGALPRTDWLGEEVMRDAKGFVLTGPDLDRVDGLRWPLERAPLTLETSVPGVFAAGDVRLDSMKRVASAVGEGAMAVHLVHRYLDTM
ncbi:FAD-dependent oxidoreductase [Rhabdothermincola salaria]|uniref:FAD-dependent oxidoreductase n=1 Tax=Rhabdothermincola salaria TaxID=2903142 RepID=UPI001E3E991B|nr:FAD-dependent oxidoreductase [Rhabdothermincola salaria]